MDRRGARARQAKLLLPLAASAALLLPGPVPAASAAGPKYRGVHVNGVASADATTLGRDLDAARGLGANVVRVDVNWGVFEPRARGQRDPVYRARVDRFMRAVSARGMKALAMVHQTPCWAPTGNPAPPHCAVFSPPTGRPPLHASDYGRFMRWFARRYRRRLAAIEIWNEPNHGFFFQADDRPAAYTKLLKAAYPQIKAVAPRVTVLAGAMSYADADFLRGLYFYGARGSYDAISVHPYMGDGSDPPDAAMPAGQEKFGFLSGLRLIRRTQRAAGDRTPVWATEFGWNTGPYRNAHMTPFLNGVSPPVQADYLGRALGLLNSRRARLGFVAGALVYNLRDTSPGGLAVGNYGLLEIDGTHKPSYAAVRRGFAAIRRSRQGERLEALGRSKRSR